MKRIAPANLRIGLSILVSLALLPLLGLILYNRLDERASAERNIESTTKDLAQATVIQEEQILEGARQLLIGMAAFPEVQNLDPEGCQPRMSALLAKLSGYSIVGAITPDGRVFCSSAEPVSSYTVAADRLYFSEAVRTGGFSIGRYQIGRLTGKKSLGIGYPVYSDDGRLLSVVFATLDLDWLDREVVSRLQLPKDGVFSLADSGGTILARNPDPGTWVGQPVANPAVIPEILRTGSRSSESRGVDGVERQYASLAVTADGHPALVTSVGINKSAALAAINAELQRDLGFLGIIAALAFGATWLLSEWLIVRPMQRLVAITGHIASGDFYARTGMQGAGEINDLASSIDEMAEALMLRREEQRQAREQLLELNQTLEDRVNARTAELQRRNAELDEFTYVVSHDLKEPLRGIAGFNALLLEDCAEELSDDGKRYIGIINDSAVRMKRLIDDLLELSRVGRISGDVGQVSVQELAEEVIADSRFSLDERNGSISTHFDVPAITADITRLKQVLRNLVSNAIKYGDKTAPKISLTCVQEDGHLLFSVSDNGEGIDPRYHEKVFGVFQRLEGRNDAEGTGVGLAICRKIVESWGGRIWVESEPGSGATFKFTMPIGSEEESETDERAA